MTPIEWLWQAAAEYANARDVLAGAEEAMARAGYDHREQLTATRQRWVDEHSKGHWGETVAQIAFDAWMCAQEDAVALIHAERDLQVALIRARAAADNTLTQLNAARAVVQGGNG